MPGPPVDTCSNSTPGRQLAQDGFEWNPCGKARKARVRTAIPTLTTGHGGLDLALAGGAGRVASRVGRLKSHTGTSYARPAKVSVIQNAPAIIEIEEENETFKHRASAVFPIPHPGH